jgi:hypothetical protein
MGNIAKLEGLMDAYPNAYEDNRGTIWVSEESSHQETDSYQDAWVEDVLGWDWENAYENFAICQRVAKRRAFWKAHPHLWKIILFLRRRRNFVMMFSGIVWRDWYGRISWSTAWKISKDVCL